MTDEAEPGEEVGVLGSSGWGALDAFKDFVVSGSRELSMGELARGLTLRGIGFRRGLFLIVQS